MRTRPIATNVRRVLMIAGVCSIPALFTGCGTSAHAGNEYGVRNNPTPALSATARRRQDEYNRYAYVSDSNVRAMREDLARALYIDRPSRLHFGPKP